MNRDGYLLLVDDEQNILKALKREFADWAYERALEILTASNAQEALALLAERGRETVIAVSDLKMPGMKGSDLLLEIQSRWPRIVTILLTGYSETEEIVKAVSAGIFSYILKPWDSQYLLVEIGKAWEHAKLREAGERHLRTLETQLRLAGELQKSILRPSVPASEKAEFRVTYRPAAALQCGGDYYDVISLGNDRYLILLGHVSAQGVQAAMITAILKAVIFPEFVRGAGASAIVPSEFLQWLNRRMNFELRQTSGIGITFFAGYLDARTGSFHYANAGAPHPILLRAGSASELLVTGTPFSASNSIAYLDQHALLQAGDAVSLFTPGLLGAEPAFTDEGNARNAPGEALIKPLELFTSVPWGTAYHRALLEKSQSLRNGRDFDDHLTILTFSML